MTTESEIQTDRAHRRTSHALIAIWSIGVGGLVLFTALQIGSAMYSNRTNADRRHEERMNPEVLESGLEPGDAELAVNADPIEVQMGVYIDRIGEGDGVDGRLLRLVSLERGQYQAWRRHAVDRWLDRGEAEGSGVCD